MSFLDPKPGLDKGPEVSDDVSKGDLDILSEGGESVLPDVDEPEVNLEEEKPEGEEKDEKPKPKGEGEEEEGKEPKEGEEEEEEEELDEELESPTTRQMTDKFPELFKEFPALRHTIFREQEFGKIYPTVDDAKEAQSKAAAMDDMEEQLIGKSDPGLLLDTLHETNSEAARKVVENFLPAVYERSKEMYHDVVTPILVRFIRHMDTEGQRTGNKNLKNSALFAGQVAFGKLEIPSETSKVTGDTDEVKGLKKQLDNERSTRRVSFAKEVQSAVDSRLKRMISKGMDPDGVLPELLRDMVVEKTASRAGEELAKDKQHEALMRSLWVKAHKSGYSADDLTRLANTYIKRIRPLVAKVRASLVEKTLKDLGKSVPKKPKPRIGGAAPPGSSGGETSSEAPDPSKVDWRKTSDLDMLEDRVVLKKK